MGAVLVTVSVYGYKRQKDRMEILTVKPCVRWRYLCEVRAGGELSSQGPGEDRCHSYHTQ